MSTQNQTQTQTTTDAEPIHHSTMFDRTLERLGIQLSGLGEYPLAARRNSPLGGTRYSESSEPFEAVRDALQLESRLRVNPPARWTPDETAARSRSWTGYGYRVELSSTLFGPWTLTVDGETVLEDADRMTAFREASRQMREIALQEGQPR